MEIALDAEELREGTRKHKKCVIDAVRAFGKLNTYGDLTAKKIMAFDTWLHNGTRTDVTCYGYHKNLRKWGSPAVPDGRHQAGSVQVGDYPPQQVQGT